MIDIGRIAFRIEGNTWCAYHAKRDTMVDANLIASVNLEMVQTEERKMQWIEMIRELFSDAVERQTGTRPTWPSGPVEAPEHERSGNA